MLTWQLVMLFLSLGIAVVAVILVVAKDKRLTREAMVREEHLNKRITVLESELSAMMDGAFGVANQLQKVETNLKDTAQRQEHLQQRDMGNLPYNEAVRLASKGAGVDELVAHCGLSRSEAELVEMLHKKSPPMINTEHEVQDVKAIFRQPEKTVQDSNSETDQGSADNVEEPASFEEALSLTQAFQTQQNQPFNQAPSEQENHQSEENTNSDDRR